VLIAVFPDKSNILKKIIDTVRFTLPKEVAATLKFFVVVSANGENYNVEPSTFYLDFGNCIPE
jgi:hypothetical protein